MLRKITTALAAFVLGFAPLLASAAISPGTEFTGTINKDLSSNSVGPGTPFTLTNVFSTDHNITGATIYGHVDSAQKAGQGTPGKIHLAFDRLVTRGGSSYALDARTTHLTANTKSNTAKEAGGALGGMIVGNILGKAIGTNIGGLLGAAGGYVVAHNNRQNVTIPAGSQVTLQVLSARPQARTS